MAYGIEIVLGFKYPKWQIIEQGLGFKMPRPIPGDPYGFPNFETGYFEDLSELEALKEYWDIISEETDLTEIPAFELAKESLEKAWHESCLDMGWEFQGQESQRINSFLYKTPLGQRELIPFAFELFYDKGEMGEQPKDAILGIAISGRYFPTFLDWEDRHGGVYNLTIGPKLPVEMEIAKKNIVKAFPFFEEADWIVKEKHY